MNWDGVCAWAGCDQRASFEQVAEATWEKCRVWLGVQGEPTIEELEAQTTRRREEFARQIEDLRQKRTPSSSPAWQMTDRGLTKWRQMGEVVDWLKAAREFTVVRQELQQTLARKDAVAAQGALEALQAIVSSHPDSFSRAFAEAQSEFDSAFPKAPQEGQLEEQQFDIEYGQTLVSLPQTDRVRVPEAPAQPPTPPHPLPAPAQPAPPPSQTPAPAVAPAKPPTERKRTTRSLGQSKPPTQAEGIEFTSDGVAYPAVKGLAPEQRVFGRYVLKSVLGRGGMGVVWLALDETLDREVALKFLPEIVLFDRSAVEGLKQETKKALELTHPNILRIYTFEYDESNAAISMEYVDGETLANLRFKDADGVCEPPQLAAWIKQLCGALDYAHKEAKVVHRDLKPANILITRDGRVKVSDFGVARSLSDSVTRTTARRPTGGTLVYCSPQQLDGEKPAVTDDIYSLGAMLYELLTGKPPFHSGDIHAQVHKKTAPSLQHRRTELGIHRRTSIPLEWETTVASCLAKSPAARPQSMAEVAERLGLAKSTTSNLASTPATVTVAPARQPSRKRRLWPAASVIAVAALLAAAAYFAWITFWPPPPPQTRVNSLGMPFVPVRGVDVAFCAWETRVSDFRAFVNGGYQPSRGGMHTITRDGYRLQNNYTFLNYLQSQEANANCPIVGVNQADAMAFCEWLTRKERSERRILSNERYRLPTDREWSVAVGLPSENGETPSQRQEGVRGLYPWGEGWPPAGNYAGTESTNASVPPYWTWLENYTDDFPRTAPVDTFASNVFGLHHMGGNVWEWCADLYRPGSPMGVLRGGAWSTRDTNYLLSSFRYYAPTNMSSDSFGFRVVLERSPIK